MTGISYEIKGSEAALAALGRAAAALDDAAPLFNAIGKMLLVSTQERFASESGPDGSPWPMSLRVKYEGGKTLSDTRRLFSSLTFEADGGSVALGTNEPYASVHQKGAVIHAKTSKGLRFRAGGNGGWVTKQSVTIPARPFLGLDGEDEAGIEWLAAKYLNSAFVGGLDADR